MSGRVAKSLTNMKVGLVFYLLSFLLAFFSRKIFLDCLGAEFIGLTGTLSEILGFLNIAELGLSGSIVYFLYKPLQEDNREEVCRITSMLAFLYRVIGIVIFTGGIVVSLFFPLIFKNEAIGLPLIYFTFYAFLASSVIGYIFNYRMLILSANQQQYLVDVYLQSMSILQGITQILLAWYFRNLYLWVSVQLLFSILGCILLNYRINHTYRWLKTDLHEGRLLLKDYPEILHKTKQLFVQCIKEFVINRCDQIMIFAFVSLKMVAFYGNYMMVINKLVYLINIMFNGVKAGIGNLIAEGNDENTMKVFWELTSLRIFATGVMIFPVTLFIQPFIECWLGAEYHLSDLIVYLLMFYFFLALMNNIVSMYIFSSGLFHDVWASVVELVLTLGGMLVLGKFWGIAGLISAKIISYLFVVTWKPYLLFHDGLHRSVWEFWRGQLHHYAIFAMFMAVVIVLKYKVVEPNVHSWLSLVGYGVAVTVPLILAYFLALFVLTDGMKHFVRRQPLLYKLLKRFIPSD